MPRDVGDCRDFGHARDFPDLSRLKAVLFDLGGTLWDPFDGKDRESVLGEVARAVALSLALRGRAADLLTASLLDSLVSLRDGQRLASCDCFADPALREGNLEEVAVRAMAKAGNPQGEQSMGESGQACVSRLALALGEELTKRSRLYDDTLPALRALRESRPDLKLGIVSNTVVQPEIIDMHLGRCGLLDLVDFRVLSSEVGWRKPHPAIYSAALVRAGARAQETLLVGDRILEDVAGPKRLGMMAALCRSLEDQRNSAVTRGPDLEVADLSTLVRLLTGT